MRNVAHGAGIPSGFQTIFAAFSQSGSPEHVEFISVVMKWLMMPKF
jgi:hypothetical protein